mmetsp:Transcript_3907/g.12290  ORF Transcript_3907/g.12290 Transcript_3907/m.12290 type:complete len:202 (+) Transcript_3907:649-1254(+)
MNTRDGRSAWRLRTSQMPTLPSNPPVRTNSAPLPLISATVMQLTVLVWSRRLVVLPVSRFHSRIVPSSCPVTSVLCDSQYASALISDRSSCSTRTHDMSYGSQMRTVLSRLEENTRKSSSPSLSGLRPVAAASAITGPWCPPVSIEYSRSRWICQNCTEAAMHSTTSSVSVRRSIPRTGSRTSCLHSTMQSCLTSNTKTYP